VAIAKIVGKDKGSIRRRVNFQRGGTFAFETAEVQTPGGLQGVALLSELRSEISLETAEVQTAAGLRSVQLYQRDF